MILYENYWIAYAKAIKLQQQSTDVKESWKLWDVASKKMRAAMVRGSIPRDPEYRRKLLLLASRAGYGAAIVKLTKLGIRHLYK